MGVFDVLPRLTANRIAHACGADSELSGKVQYCLAFPSPTPNLNHDCFSQLCTWVLGTYPSWSGDSSFVRSIPHVVRLCAEKQVRWIAAGRIIAAMADIQGIVVNASGQDDGDTVGVGRASLAGPMLTVSILAEIPSPWPTRIRTAAAINQQPERFNLGWGKIQVHLLRLLQWVPRPRLYQQRSGTSFVLPILPREAC